MPNPLALALAGLLTLLLILLLRRARWLGSLVRALRTIRPTPLSTDSGLLQQTHGRLETDLPLTSPFQKRPCVYYFFRVQTPQEGRRPRSVATGKEWTMARVRDATGTADVDAVSAVVSSPRRHEAVLRNLTTIPPGLEGFFEQAGIDEKHLRRLPVLIVHEYTLEPADDVYVTGAVDRQGARPRFHRTKRVPLVVSADADLPITGGLRNELILYASLVPFVAASAIVLAVLGLAG